MTNTNKEIEIKEYVEDCKINDMLYTVKEVAKIIKTSPPYVYSLIKSNKLPSLKLGSLKVRKTTLENFLEQYEGYDLTDPYNIKPLNLEVSD